MSTSAAYSTANDFSSVHRDHNQQYRDRDSPSTGHSSIMDDSSQMRPQISSPSSGSFVASSSSSSGSLSQLNSLNGPLSCVSSSSSSTVSSSGSNSFSSSITPIQQVKFIQQAKFTSINRNNNLSPFQINEKFDSSMKDHQQYQNKHYYKPQHQYDQCQEQPYNDTGSFTVHSLEPKPLKSYKTSSEYVEAMKEDLAEWLNQLYPDLDLDSENFFQRLETGAIICRHANHVTTMGRKFASSKANTTTTTTTTITTAKSPPLSSSKWANQDAGRRQSLIPTPMARRSRIPRCGSSLLMSSSQSYHCLSSIGKAKFSMQTSPSSNLSAISTKKLTDKSIDWFKVNILPYKQDARPGTFFARDNICQFILWCRTLNIIDCLLFETDDLVARKNVKSFILCLLEVARIGCKVGVPTPLIIQLEQEIDREIENDAKLQEQLPFKPGDNVHVDDDDDDDDDISDRLHQSCQFYETSYNQIMKSQRETDEEKQDEEQDDQDEKDYGPKPQVITNDLVSLHEKIQIIF